MKTLKFLLFILIVLTSCASNGYLLSGNGQDKKYLINYIDELQKENKVLKYPLVIVDGKPYRHDVELSSNKLPISKKDITYIRSLDWKSAKNIYGGAAKDGAIIISTRPIKEQIKELISANEKMLFLLNGKRVAVSDINDLNFDFIREIEIVKNKEMIKKYTSEDYDGVIILQLKN